MKRIFTTIFFMFINITLYTYPAFGQDIFKKENQNDFTYSEIIPKELDEEFYKLIIDSTHIVEKYCNTNFVHVQEFPNNESKIIFQLLYNSKVEVIAIYNNWSCIVIEDKIAFIDTQYLNDYEMPQNEYTDEELYIMAHILAGECQGYPDIEQLYVGSVVLNRVHNEKYPNTIKEVVFQKRQYSCIYDGNYYRDPTNKNWENAKWLLKYGSILPDNVVYQATKKQGKGVYLKTEYHYYCYE